MVAHKRTPEHHANLMASLEARGWGGRKHGYAPRGRGKKSPTWYSWASMLDRCTNPNAANWNRYGGRGIKIVDAWQDFAVFLADVGERPEGKTLDRIDNNGNYEPGNCRWATVQENNQNRKYSTACKNGCTCKRHHGRVFCCI